MSRRPSDRPGKAAALRYDPSRAGAPTVAAKGRGYVAEAITAIAREHHVPIHQDPNLVEVLEALDLDLEIPPETLPRGGRGTGVRVPAERQSEAAMTPFDVHRAPLEGRNLIEAAAGTGKTWSIEQLFVRLVLEQGCRVDEILTVTFTQAATDELRDRIHRQLLAARRDARDRGRGGAGGSEAISGRIERAIADFDRAAIYTIHGFCQRVLREHAFETGSSFTTELVPDQTALLREVTEDYWRRVLAAAPAEAVACLLARLKGPDGLLSVYNRIKAPVFRVLPQPAVVPLTALEGYRRTLTTLRGSLGSGRGRCPASACRSMSERRHLWQLQTRGCQIPRKYAQGNAGRARVAPRAGPR